MFRKRFSARMNAKYKGGIAMERYEAPALGILDLDLGIDILKTSNETDPDIIEVWWSANFHQTQKNTNNKKKGKQIMEKERSFWLEKKETVWYTKSGIGLLLFEKIGKQV